MGDEVEFTGNIDFYIKMQQFSYLNYYSKVRPDPLAKQTQQGRCHATRIRIISSRNTRYDNHNQEKEPETGK